MKTKMRRFMQQAASNVEIFLAAFLLLVIIYIVVKFLIESVSGIGNGNTELEYFLENVMTLAIGVEFVKMLCTHTPGTVVEVLLFAISRQMIVEHQSSYESLAGIAAIAGLFAIRKFLFCKEFGSSDKESDEAEEKDLV